MVTVTHFAYRMRRTALVIVAVVVLSLSVTSAEAASKKYQVTGKITSLTESVITLDKAGESFEIDRDPSLKIDGKLAVGEKITVYYHMVADSVKAK